MKKASRKQKLRPTSQLVKQAVFNILGDIEGLTFFDLFAGTGQVGLMAEYRGAEVIFVEKSPKLAGSIRRKTGGQVFTMDVLNFLKSTESMADIIFADPPYAYEKYEELIDLSIKKLKEGGIFILEHSNKLEFGAPKKKVYGDTALSIWRKEA
ncbi:MAG: RsmD family RNA methyltransferase [Aquificaceae bacterium]